MVDAIQISAMLPAVVEPAARDLRKLTSSVETPWCQRISRGGVHTPIGISRTVGIMGWERGAVEKEGFVVAVPWVSLDWKGIGGVGSALMVSMNYLHVFELIRRVYYWILVTSDMGHIAPIVRS